MNSRARSRNRLFVDLAPQDVWQPIRRLGGVERRHLELALPIRRRFDGRRSHLNVVVENKVRTLALIMTGLEPLLFRKMKMI